MYKIKTTHQFEKDLLRCKKRGYPMDKLRKVIQLLEKMVHFLHNIALTSCKVIVLVSGNVIFNLIGY